MNRTDTSTVFVVEPMDEHLAALAEQICSLDKAGFRTLLRLMIQFEEYWWKKRQSEVQSRDQWPDNPDLEPMASGVKRIETLQATTYVIPDIAVAAKAALLFMPVSYEIMATRDGGICFEWEIPNGDFLQASTSNGLDWWVSLESLSLKEMKPTSFASAEQAAACVYKFLRDTKF